MRLRLPSSDVEFEGEAAHVALRIGRTEFAGHCREARHHRVLARIRVVGASRQSSLDPHLGRYLTSGPVELY